MRALGEWSYNTRQELTGTSVMQPPGTSVPAQARAYAYDPIGNRTQSTTGTADPVHYCTNGVNQYEATAAAPGCATPTESFGHDADGNLEYDGTFLYEWDGENRLKAVYKADPTTGDKKLVFDYDYMSRRVRKRAFAWTGSAWPDPQTATPEADERFVYDEWNVIMVLNGLDSNAITRKYTWGLDLSGTFHDAGGIGGLLACEEPGVEETRRYWFMYDASGNVGQVIDATSFLTLGIAARYEYDAYGNALVAAGSYAAANPFRFSTKRIDNETGLHDYGFRLYFPQQGRWLSRDPLEETGGMNLYMFVANTPSNEVDPLGLCTDGDSFTGSVAIPGSAHENCTTTNDTKTVKVKGSLNVSIKATDAVTISLNLSYDVDTSMTVAPCMYKWLEYTYTCACSVSESWETVCSYFPTYHCRYKKVRRSGWSCTPGSTRSVEKAANCPS